MEDDLRHVKQALEGLEQQLSYLAKGVKDLRRKEETILEQSSRRNLGGHPMHNNQWGYCNFSPHARSYERNSYDCYEGKRVRTRNGHNYRTYNRVPRTEVRNKGNYVNIYGKFDKRRAWEYEVESLFCAYCVREEENFQLVLKSLFYEKFEAQNMLNEGSLGYKLYETISFLPSKSFLSFDFIINESNHCSFSFFCDRIQSQFLDFLTVICGTKPNHSMKAKGEDMRKELTLAMKTHQ
ncbi:hypothetical protein M9H77_02605 [Catharanthus roseus]|uniref:Uncharacterized protein n=1 Tax=Catharanthus roseus TaxID=4058 RepID=A0ACC0C9A4_CATRO|nr:hypothetical protein M9H77_02605 [Catharanthus roseus]